MSGTITTRDPCCNRPARAGTGWAHRDSTAIWRLKSRQNPHAGKAAGWRSFPAPHWSWDILPGGIE